MPERLAENVKIYLEKSNPRIEINSHRWPFQTRLWLGLGLILGINLILRGPDIITKDLKIIEVENNPIKRAGRAQKDQFSSTADQRDTKGKNGH